MAKSTANEMKYRATELHREQDYEEILAKARAEEAAEAAVRAAGEAKQRAEATQDAMEKAALAQLRAQWNRPPNLLTTMMVDIGVQISFVSDLSIEASRPLQQVVVTKIAEEDVVINDKALVGFPMPAVKGTRSRSIRRSCGLFGGLSKVHRKETFAEREQREKEEREKRSAQREKMKKEEKERNDELVSNLKVECWELYRCTKRWMTKLDKFDLVKRRADFDHEIARRSVIGLSGRYKKEPKELADDLKVWKVELEKQIACVETNETKMMERADQEAYHQNLWDRILRSTTALVAATTLPREVTMTEAPVTISTSAPTTLSPAAVMTASMTAMMT